MRTHITWRFPSDAISHPTMWRYLCRYTAYKFSEVGVSEWKATIGPADDIDGVYILRCWGEEDREFGRTWEGKVVTHGRATD